jgi:hypothetical protein
MQPKACCLSSTLRRRAAAGRPVRRLPACRQAGGQPRIKKASCGPWSQVAWLREPPKAGDRSTRTHSGRGQSRSTERSIKEEPRNFRFGAPLLHPMRGCSTANLACSRDESRTRRRRRPLSLPLEASSRSCRRCWLQQAKRLRHYLAAAAWAPLRPEQQAPTQPQLAAAAPPGPVWPKAAASRLAA